MQRASQKPHFLEEEHMFNTKFATDLFELITAAQKEKDYPVANAAFAALLDLVFDHDNAYPMPGQTEVPLFIEWETEDPTGRLPGDGPYDLLSVCDRVGRVVRIPAPLLSGWILITILKRCMVAQAVVARGRLNSEGESAIEADRVAVRERLAKVLTPDKSEWHRHLIQQYLAPGEEREAALNLFSE
jgi:hypothetical protein